MLDFNLTLEGECSRAGLDDGETDCDLGNAAEAYLLKCYR